MKIFLFRGSWVLLRVNSSDSFFIRMRCLVLNAELRYFFDILIKMNNCLFGYLLKF